MTEAEASLDASQPSPEKVADLVRSLATVMCQSDVTELDLQLGGVAIRLRRPQGGEIVESASGITHEPVATTPEQQRGHVVTSPMVGTFYASPTPSAAAFVAVGDHVAAGQTIGIIEAMKIMNEIAADRPGVVAEFLVGNAQPVEYGSPLLRLVAGREDRG